MDNTNERLVVREKVTKCVGTCRFYFKSMDGMECTHPYFKDKGAYRNMIITHDIDIPEQCPLRKQEVEIVISLG